MVLYYLLQEWQLCFCFKKLFTTIFQPYLCFRRLYAHLWLPCCVVMTTLLCLPWIHVFISGWINLIMLIFCSSNPSFCPPNNPFVKSLTLSYKSLVFTQCWPLKPSLRERKLCTRIKLCFKINPNSETTLISVDRLMWKVDNF